MMDKNKVQSWVIYTIVSPSNRVYVGLTRNFGQRMYKYKKLLCKPQKSLYASLCKYGYDSHEIKIVDEFLGDFNEANGKEIFWIRSYMSNKNKYPSQNGLNLTNGGDGTNGHKMSEENKEKLRQSHRSGLRKTKKGYVPTEETRKKQSLSRKGVPNFKNRGRKKTPEQLKILSNRMKGMPSPNKGKKMSQDQKDKVSAFHKGNTYRRGAKFTPEQIKRLSEALIKVKGRGVNQYDLNGEFIAYHRAIIEASKNTGVPTSTMGEILSGRVKNPKKYIFKYSE